MTISYTRTFTHIPWIDRVDRVQAGGDGGFNGRFHGIEAEFDTLSQVVKQISEALDVLEQKPPPKPVRLTLVPILAQVGGAGWKQEAGSVLKPVGATEASGVTNIVFPPDARLQSLRVIGSKQSGSLSVNLNRQPVSGATGAQRIAGVDAPNGAFDQTATVPNTDVAKIDNDNFQYYLTADLTAAGAGDLVAISCFQLTYVGQ